MNLKVKIFALIVFLSFIRTAMLQAQQDAKKTYPAQLTFFYPIGTNGAASDSTSYNFSLNMLWGLTGGIKGTEIGGLINKTNGTLSGVQLGGLGNFAAGNVTGAQLSGLINTSTSFQGTQVGGIINIVDDKISASMPEGPAYVKPNEGVQAAGVYNFQADSLKGVQIAGVININKQHIKGAQVAGILNKTKSLSGVQIGLINIVDTIQSGVSIGLINIVKSNSYKALEIESNESFYANISYKMGTKQFYSIFSFGFTHQNQKEFWALGVGLGSYFPVGNITGINIDLVNYHLNEGEWWTNTHNQLSKLKINCAFQLAPKFSVFGGFSVNVLVSEIKNAEGSPTGSYFKTPNTFYEKVNSNTRIVIYPGLNAGIRF